MNWFLYDRDLPYERVKKYVITAECVNPFLATHLFLYPPDNIKKQGFSVFRGVQKETSGIEWVNVQEYPTFISMTVSKHKYSDQIDDKTEHRYYKQPLVFDMWWVESSLKNKWSHIIFKFFANLTVNKVRKYSGIRFVFYYLIDGHQANSASLSRIIP